MFKNHHASNEYLMISNDILLYIFFLCDVFSSYVFLLVFSWSPCHEIGQGVQFSFWTSSLSMNLDCKWCLLGFLNCWTPQKVPKMFKKSENCQVGIAQTYHTCPGKSTRSTNTTNVGFMVRCWIRALALPRNAQSHSVRGTVWKRLDPRVSRSWLIWNETVLYQYHLLPASSGCVEERCLNDLQAVLELPACLHVFPISWGHILLPEP